jgi:hypothetical protein
MVTAIVLLGRLVGGLDVAALPEVLRRLSLPSFRRLRRVAAAGDARRALSGLLQLTWWLGLAARPGFARLGAMT